MNWNQNNRLQDVGTSYLQEQLDPATDMKVQHLEKRLQELQDYTEDLTFKAQRHEEAATSLRSQNTFLVRKCSDLQRQLIECLATVDVLDIRCNDAESKLKRVRLALEEKECALLNMSGELFAALLKIKENEREMEKVQTEMDNVNCTFMKVSCNQRELKEDVLFYENILKARDQKIQRLLEDRLRVSICLKKLKSQILNEVTCLCRNIDEDALKRRGSSTQVPENDQCAQLMKNISVGDDLLTERMRMLKSDNVRLASQVSSLNNELGNRCAVNVLRMNQVLEKITNVEDDMVSFLTLLEKEADPCQTQGGIKANPLMHDELNRSVGVTIEHSDLMQELAKVKEETVALRLSNFYLENLIKKQLSSFGTICQILKAHSRQEQGTSMKDKLFGGKIDSTNMCGSLNQTENLFIKSNQMNSTEHQEMSTLQNNLKNCPFLVSELNKAKSKPVFLLETLQNIVQNADRSIEPLSEESVQDFFHMIDFLCVSQICSNAYEELFRLSVLLQVSLLKMRNVVPEEKQYYAPIMSGLKGALLKIRSTMLSYESVNLKGAKRDTTEEDENCTIVIMPMWMYYGALEDEANISVSSTTGSNNQLSTYKNRFVSKEVLATIGTEGRMGQKRNKTQRFYQSHVRPRSGDSPWPSKVARKDNRLIQKAYSGGQHQVCTDLVVNLQRNLRASERNNFKIQEKLGAKSKELETLQQEILNLRLSLEVVNDTLDNKKIALGRSESVWQMLRVSEASLEQRLEVEQRQHEYCRQQLDKLASSLEEMRTTCEEKVPRDDSKGKQDAASTTISLPSYSSVMNTEVRSSLKRANGRNRKMIRAMNDYVSLMMNDMNLLQHHFGEKQDEPLDFE